MAIALGVTLAGCVIGDGGLGAGDDDDGPGSNPGPVPETPTPKLDVSVDKDSLSTELMTTNMITVTAQASGGFGGQVMLAATAVDMAGAVLPGWMIALDKSTVEVPVNGTATVVATVTIPSDSHGLAGRLKIDATSSLGPMSVGSTVAVANQITYNLTLNAAGKCAYPAAAIQKVTNGTKIRWVNNTQTKRTIIHVESNGDNEVGGVSHQDAGGPGSAQGEAYEQTVNGTVGQTTFWYCHSPGDSVSTLRLQVVP